MTRLETLRAKTVLATAVLLVGALAAEVPRAAAESVYGSGLFELGDGVAPPLAGQAQILDNPDRPGPDWSALFAADGSPRDDHPFDLDGNPAGNGIPDYRELYSGLWAVFTSDDVSLGSGFESTALYPDGRIYNATAAAEHDLGNAYVYATTDAAGNLVLYAGAERLAGGDSQLEFEFNQGHFRLGHGGYGRGVPWEIVGSRHAGDLLVTLTFSGGALSSAQLMSWADSEGVWGWQHLETVIGENCDAVETACVVCNSAEIAGGPWGSASIAQNHFVELGVNVGALLGVPGYTTIQLRTPEDAAFGYFAEGN